MIKPFDKQIAKGSDGLWSGHTEKLCTFTIDAISIISSYIEIQSCYFIVYHILQYYSVWSPLMLSYMA